MQTSPNSNLQLESQPGAIRDEQRPLPFHENPDIYPSGPGQPAPRGLLAERNAPPTTLPPSSTESVQSRSGNAAGAARENEILAQVQREHPDWTVSQKLQEAARRSERRVTPRNGHAFTEAERQKFLAEQKRVEAARHPNRHLAENPFDRHPSHSEVLKTHDEALDVLSGRKPRGQSIVR